MALKTKFYSKDNNVKLCVLCSKKLSKRNKSGYCRTCSNRREENRKKNSEGLKKAHREHPEKWEKCRGPDSKKVGIVSKEWIKENPEAYKSACKKQGETRSRRIKAGEIKASFLGKHHTRETRKIISEKRNEYLKNNNNYGLKWYTVDGIRVQGTWEKVFAEHLTKNKISWNRRTIIFDKNRRYTPDFYCPDEDCYFEIKGFLRDRDLYKMYLVLEEHPSLNIKMIREKELKNLNQINIFSLPNFNEIYLIKDIDESKFNNVWLKPR